VTRRRRDELEPDRRARGAAELPQHPWPGKRALTDALGRAAPRDLITIPGKRALTDGMSRRTPVDGGRVVERKANGAGLASVDPRQVAAEVTQGRGEALPHLDVIQRAFGLHDVTGIQAHVGGDAVDASDMLGAEAFATGTHVAFRSTPTLHSAAYEATHVVQLRAGASLSGALGADGDAYERHADAVADAVVRGEPVEGCWTRSRGRIRGPSPGLVSRAATYSLQPHCYARAAPAPATIPSLVSAMPRLATPARR
jgi:hypothetical protein